MYNLAFIPFYNTSASHFVFVSFHKKKMGRDWELRAHVVVDKHVPPENGDVQFCLAVCDSEAGSLDHSPSNGSENRLGQKFWRIDGSGRSGTGE